MPRTTRNNYDIVDKIKTDVNDKLDEITYMKSELFERTITKLIELGVISRDSTQVKKHNEYNKVMKIISRTIDSAIENTISTLSKIGDDIWKEVTQV